jgi:hypothetical protein
LTLMKSNPNLTRKRTPNRSRLLGPQGLAHSVQLHSGCQDVNCREIVYLESLETGSAFALSYRGNGRAQDSTLNEPSEATA